MHALTLVGAIKLVAEIALMALLGQGLLALLVGRKREGNLFYQVLAILTRPFIRATRFITPGFVIDRHVPYVTFLLLVVVWFGTVVSKAVICGNIGVEHCLS